MLFLAWLTFGRAILTSGTATCWTALGAIAPNDQPCYPDQPKHSLCCPTGSICSANKLCILPSGGQAHRGTCTDRSWGRECPHFCISEHSGGDGLTGVNMTQCNTTPTSTTYCCDDWMGRACDCTNLNIPKTTLELFKPLAIIPAKNVEVSESAEEPDYQYDIPWNTVGPILATIMSILLLGMLVYLARYFYLSLRKKDPTRNHSFMEHGRRFSEFFWNQTTVDEKARSDSKFSIGTLDTEVDNTESRKMSMKSVRISVGRRSKSEGDRAQVAEPPQKIVWNDSFTGRQQSPRSSYNGGQSPRTSVATPAPAPTLTPTSASTHTPKSVSRLAARPTFKRQDTDVAGASEARKAPAKKLSVAGMLNSPFVGRQDSSS